MKNINGLVFLVVFFLDLFNVRILTFERQLSDPLFIPILGFSYSSSQQ